MNRYFLAATMVLGLAGSASASDCIVGGKGGCAVPNPLAQQRDHRNGDNWSDARRQDEWRHDREDAMRREEWRDDRRRREEFGDRRLDDRRYYDRDYRGGPR